ncbi:uncharacterized protein LOC134812275 isoform X2 [Bolinopsis microptera]|uniref:uncharacterized protein LOC134812275 isoform X2 n=1 Tax=Bolinopsis microptera TaxID=2820187 RepID=UPI003079BB3B
MLVLVLQLLVTTVKSDMVCDSDGVKCVKDPANCDSSAPTDCNYLLKYKAASADTTKIEISGKPSKFSLTSYLENMWLVFGFSPSSSGMSGINLYACQLVGGTQYDVRKLKTNGYSGVDNAGSAIVAKGGSVSGSNQDDLMSCSYEILNSELPTSNQYLVKAMGPMAGENSMSKHRMTPKRGTLMKLQQEFIPPVECPVGEKEVNNDCQKCPAGDYQDLTGQTSCKTCEENQFSAEAGQTQCEKCPDNTFSEEKADQCVDCPTETETSIRDSMENRNFGELLIQKCIDDNEESNEGEGEKKTDMIVETVTIEVHLEILRPGYLYYHSFQFG